MSWPRIGVAIGRATATDGRLMDAVPHEYAEAVSAAGGLPLLLPRLAPGQAQAAVSAIDGLLLTGGGDVGPSCYHALTGPHTDGLDPERDEAELALVAVALAHDLPLLGTCRGAQVVNVAMGGTLHQHLADHSTLPHDDWDGRYRLAHQVTVAPGSTLAGIVGPGPLGVNSVHHQGIDRLGKGLQPVAWAEDGLVEAVEGGAGLLAVQWHPELVQDQPGAKELFAWLVAKSLAAATPV